MKILILLLATLPLTAQTRVLATPESMKSDVLSVSQIGLWDISVVNLGPTPTAKSLTEILMYAPAIHRIAPARTAQVINVDVANSKAQRLIRVLSYVDLVAPAIFPGIVAINATGIASLALGTAVVHHFTDTLKARQPDQNAYTSDSCPDTITLAPYGTPGYAITCSVFSSLVHNAATIGPVDIPAVPGLLKAEIDPGIYPVPIQPALQWKEGGAAVFPESIHQCTSPDGELHTVIGKPCSEFGHASIAPTPPALDPHMEAASWYGPELDESDRFSAEFVALVAMKVAR